MPLALPAAAVALRPERLTYLSAGDQDTLDPAWCHDTPSLHVIANIYEGLVGLKGESLSEFEPRLAREVPSHENGLISSDGRTYRFPLRQGVRFHEGELLTSEDVKYSILRRVFLDCSRGSSLAEAVLGSRFPCAEKGNFIPEAFQTVDSAIQAEKDSIIIHLPQPFAPLLAVLAQSGEVLSQSWCRKHGDWDGQGASLPQLSSLTKQDSFLHEHANGTGPFALERWDKTTRQILLKRHEGYWRVPARLERIAIKTVYEFNTRKLMLQNGDADVMGVSLVDLPHLQGVSDVEVLEGLKPLVRNPLLFFNFRINTQANRDVGSGQLDGEGIPPDFFTDKEIRRAFAFSIDYETYLREVLRGKGQRASGFIPPGLIGHSEDAFLFQFDLKRAAVYFRKARGGEVWDKGFKFTLVVNTGSAWRLSLADIIKKNVESLNPKFQIQVRAVEWSSFLDLAGKEKLALYLQGIAAEYPDPHVFAQGLLHSQGSFARRFGYSFPEADRLISEALSQGDAVQREDLYRRLQQLAFEEIPFVPIADQGDALRAQRTWVQGYRFNPIFPSAPSGSYYYDLWKAQR